MLINSLSEPKSGYEHDFYQALRHDLSGYWSRRINEEHRLVYKVHDDELWIVQARYHYTDC